jgi:3-hydroxyacyl-CoA dehydrogenase/enoyl-CoA hydratase/3-hydroxybutyryl-CoA epimerase
MRRFGMPMGPLELLDTIGIDVAAHVFRSVQPYFGERFPANPALENMRQAGLLGAKAGQGFYLHDGKKPRENPAVVPLLGAAATPAWASPEEVRERLVLLMVNEAAACLGEGVAATADTSDLGMVFGTGWAPHRGGPLRYADDRGLPDVVRALASLQQKFGPHFEPCAELRRRAESGEPFYDAALAPLPSS